MSKISVIIQREYVSRVKKKSFIIMTLLAPVLMAAIFVVPALLMTNQDADFKKIAVIEKVPGTFRNVIKNTKDAEFVYIDSLKIDDIKTTFAERGYYGVLYISPEVATIPDAVQLISRKQPPIGLLEHIESSLEKDIEKQKLLTYNIDNLDSILKGIQTSVNVQTLKMDELGNEMQTSTGISMALAYLLGFLMYMLTFIFGAQVMRGVIEEKTNRVVEVIISSVKPVELMIGKIIGIAMVGLTQFLIWIILTAGIATFVKSSVLPADMLNGVSQTISKDVMASDIPGAETTMQQSDAATTFSADFTKGFTGFINQRWGLIIPAFIFYFITGYLLYASVFAAIGSAVDNETETQQFMLPVTIPIILALFVAMSIMNNPESSIAFWFSMIPLTSPIVMIARIPFDVPGWQIAVSMGIMLVTIILFIWMAAKIYRTGILMYGKKASWKEMWKWLRFSG